jgi:hypothetical protein
MVRLLIRRGDGNSKPQALRRRSHSRYHGQGLIHWPLSTACDSWLEVPWAFVDVVATKHIRDKDAVEFCRLEEFGELDPVVDGIEISRAVIRVLPESGRLMAGAHFYERIEYQRLLWLIAVTTAIGSHVEDMLR